ncbi:MAG: DUF2339 domain-containing protein [Campylobacterota bacterium]|nr:DUF2339 domain-containing protein [Campylobacterota bacterium]
MFVVIATAFLGLLFGDTLFYSPLLGMILGLLSAIIYNVTQKLTTLETKIKDQEEIIENLLDNQPYQAPQRDVVEEKKLTPQESFKTELEERVITQPTINLTKNEELIVTLPIEEVEEKTPIEQTPLKDEKRIDFIDSLARVLIGENPIVRIGGVILFLGLAFFAKFLIDHSIITLEMRLIFLGIVAIALIVLGWRWRDKEGDYGLILQAIGVATLYLDIYSAAKLYHLVDLKIAFMLMLFVVLLASWLSIIQKSLPLILFSITGGFLVPILTSDGSGSHIVLFSYYALLNLAIVIIAYFHSWRILNLVGFAFTFIIATWWGVLRYEEELFASTEPFLILFFLFYLAINILFTLRLKAFNIKYVDTAMTFALPFIAFAFQDAMIGYDDTVMALSALVFALIYGVLSYLLNYQSKDLAYAFFSLAIIFLTIAIGYSFDNEMLSIIWSVEAVGTIWIALKQDRVLTRSIALVVMGFSLLVTLDRIALEESILLFSVPFLTALFVFAMLFVILWLYHYYAKNLRPWEEATKPFMLGFGLFIYQFIGFMKFDIYDSDRAVDYFILYTSMVSLILMQVALWSEWKTMQRYLGSFFIVGALFILLLGRLVEMHPFEDLGIVALPLFFITYHLLAYNLESQWGRAGLWQVLSSLLLVLILSLELSYHANRQEWMEVYRQVAWGVMVLISFGIVYLIGNRWLFYPIQKHFKAYNFYFLGFMAIGVLIWSTVLFFYVTPSYIPLLNILDSIAIATIISIYYYITHNVEDLEDKEPFFILLGIYALIFISVILARSMYSFGGVEYSEAILNNNAYQMGLSILWSLVAFVLMILSQKLQSQGVWIASMSLIGITVLKLLFIDLANSGTLERIISFVGAGVLILIIGYFFKMPSKDKADQ